MHYLSVFPHDSLDFTPPSTQTLARTQCVPEIFQVNKYTLYPNTQVDSLSSLINRIKLDPEWRLISVWIGGSASPEGPVRWNWQLGDYRSRALADYLRKHTELQADELRIDNLWEDWESTECALEQLPDFPFRDQILDIIRTEPDRAERKMKIKALDGGQTWWKLIREVYPPFRNARMVIAVQPYTGWQLRPHTDETAQPREVAPQLAVDYLPALYVPQSRHATRFFAVKTNGIFVGLLTANLGFEVELWRHWSLDVPVWYSPYDIKRPTRKLRLLATQPELRWWPGSKTGSGHFVGAHLHVVGFNVAINDHGRYQDPNHALFGAGVGYGYAFQFGTNRHWMLELNAGVGYADYKYDVYRNWWNGPRYIQGIHSHYWGLTRAGVNLGYKWYKPRKRSSR